MSTQTASDPDGDATSPETLTIDFSRDGNSGPYRSSGWSEQEDRFVWTVGPTSRLTIDGLTSLRDRIIELDVAPCVAPPSVKEQLLAIRVNGHFVGRWRLSERALLRFAVPDDVIGADEKVEIEFQHPCFVSRAILEKDGEERLLAVCFYHIWLSCSSSPRANSQALPLAPDGTESDLSGAHDAVDEVRREKQRYSFGPSGTDRAVLREGWYVDHEGSVWAGAYHNRIEIPAPPFPAPYFLRVSLAPLCIRYLLPKQRITLTVNDLVVGQFRLQSDTSLLFRVPAGLPKNGQNLSINFVTPDGFALKDFNIDHPDDTRVAFLLDQVSVEPILSPQLLRDWTRDDEAGDDKPLAVSREFLDDTLESLPTTIEAGLGISLKEMLRLFESLGDNCGLGLVQRKAGVEILGLLRFASVPVQALFRGLDDEFKATTNPSDISLALGVHKPREYLLDVKRYGIRWHTRAYEHSFGADEVLRDQSTKIGYLRRKFYEGLSGGRKIYVITRANPRLVKLIIPTVEGFEFRDDELEPLRLAEVLPVYFEINRHGRNALLYVVPSGEGHPSGSVELLAPGLMRGHIASFVISEDATVLDHAEWLRVLANAVRLNRGAAFTMLESP